MFGPSRGAGPILGEPVAAVVAPDRFWPRNAFDLIEVPAASETRRPNLSRADAGRAPSTCPQGKHGGARPPKLSQIAFGRQRRPR